MQNNAAAVSPLERLPISEPPVDRAALLVATMRAASAAALGQDDAEAQRALSGRPFEVRIRFGCPGDAFQEGGNQSFEVSFDEEKRTLRVRAAPDLSLDDPRVAAVASGAAEAVEGFWLRRPWLLADGCPALPPVPEPAPPTAEPDDAPEPAAPPGKAPDAPAVTPQRSAQPIGIAQFFTSSDARTGRRDERAYEATKVLGANEQPSAQGYNLVLTGRLRQLPGRKVISCGTGAPDQAPGCLISAEFDRVWIEHPATKSVLADWAS